MPNENAITQLSKRLGYYFKQTSLLSAAITHRSSGGAHNERLEFLGDSFLNFTIAAHLYARFPKAKEGELTRMRARLVRQETLAEIARDLNLGDYLFLGPGELKSGGFQRDSILADALEAVIGALFLDAGMNICQERIMSWYQTRLEDFMIDATNKDAKTRLQEYLQAKKLPLPEYQILNIEGDAHDPIFRVRCTTSLIKEPIIGIANSRRKAEQMAAENTLKVLKNGE